MAAFPHLLVRADGSPSIGTGHVMRTLAVVQAWRCARGRVTYAACSLPSNLQARLKSEGCRVEVWNGVDPGGSEDAHRTREAVERIRPTATVLDGYRFRTEFRRRVASSAPTVSLFFHDYAIDEPLWCDYLLNPNPHARPSLYPRIEDARKLLGLAWVPLRREFLRAAAGRLEPGFSRPEAPGETGRQGPTRILVTLGGGDPEDYTGLVLRALDKVAATLEVRVVVGPANPRLQVLRRRARGARHPTRVLFDVADMAGLMAWADLAVAAAGSTSWELAWMGVPWLAVALAENQRPILDAVDSAGMAISLGWREEVDEVNVARTVSDLVADPERCRLMAARGRSAVDGRGARRIAALLMGQG